tara:strand:- start:5 stop:196 length:192 start_codon:yes stop_codon:yes gene_type:complete
MLTEREIEVIKLRKKGLKQSEISKKLKLSQPAISGFERNANKKIKDVFEILKIIKKIGVKIEK